MMRLWLRLYKTDLNHSVQAPLHLVVSCFNFKNVAEPKPQEATSYWWSWGGGAVTQCGSGSSCYDTDAQNKKQKT
jgi:hypothetical protein